MISNKGQGQVVPQRREPYVPRGQRRVERTSAGLRNALFDEIDSLRAGEGDPQQAMAVAKLAAGILQTAKLEYQFKQAGFPTNTPIPPLMLGDESDDEDPES